MLTKRYQTVNNIGGWFVFLVALVTYWLTLEPTASFWDCGEFIIQADKLEVGHPPGNPIFMLTARFFANFAPSAEKISVMVNAMSGLLSALTILLLFWTISHLVRKLVIRDDSTTEPTIAQYIGIMGSAAVGSLAYCWSDTFWFSAVEGEVYAFSSFCTALVFWLILKWENRADEPGSDRYLILIAYIIGVSIAVHLLNLLCIPAIVLVYAYRRFKNMNLVKSLIALAVSFGIIVLVLYGLVPGFIKVAQWFELLFVNDFGMSFNSGAIAYALILCGVFAWAILELRRQKSARMVIISFLIAVMLSGIFIIGSVWTAVVLLVLLAVWLIWRAKNTGIPVRALNLVLWSMAVIFVGYSSYALILIRSTADTPMNQNSPDNVFDLASYLNREQYGENPLIYGETMNSSPMKQMTGSQIDTIAVREDGSAVTLTTPYYTTIINPGKALYAKGVKGAEPTSEYGFLSEGEKASNHALSQKRRDYYVKRDYKPEARMNPELNMLFPRLYSRLHRDAYAQWTNLDTLGGSVEPLYAVDAQTGEKVPELDTYAEPVYNEYTGTLSYPQKQAFRPGFFQNLSYFFNYQLNHMYTRYFLWNFAGRQNDVNNQQGELDAGNWISGIPFIDNPRLGDQSLLPDDLGKNNAGHNVYYMLPLLLGLIGLVWQSFAGKRGIEQFWVVFFLFFMTGIAIVIYLNQTPNQPRERDYAFAGSFYAYAIWLGMGVAGLWKLLMLLADKLKLKLKEKETLCAGLAALFGICVPIQMVSQTWDDHDRSGRYAARDFAVNYLESLEPNAIVFCNGDNDTFPLWYAQEVEGVRPDVKIINLSYLNSDWYANQQRMQSYDAPPVKFTAKPTDYAYGHLDVVLPGRSQDSADLLSSLKALYAGLGNGTDTYPTLASGVVTIPVDKKKVIERGLVAAKDSAEIVDKILIDLPAQQGYRSKGYLGLGEVLMLDIIATNAANGWERPIYWASTVGDEYHLGLSPYLRSTGMTHQLVPTIQEEKLPRTDRAYGVVTEKYRWGGADTKGKAPYFDETVRRMLVSVRSSMVDVVSELLYEGDVARSDGNLKLARSKYEKALKVNELLVSKLQDRVSPFDLSSALTSAQGYCELGDKERLNRPDLMKKGLGMLKGLLERYGQYIVYNRDVTRRFINPSLTYESQLIPYKYYRIIDLYRTYGGSEKEIKSILNRFGMKEAELKQAYDHYTGALSSQQDGEDPGITMEELATEIAKYCEIANHLAAMSPAEYAQATEDEKMIDSMVWQVIEYYVNDAGNDEELKKFEAYRAYDKERGKRLNSMKSSM